jgi:hypothetical protein
MFDRSHNQVRRIKANLAGAFTLHFDREAGFGCLNDDFVIQTQRQTQTVEAWPQIGTGGRDDGSGRQPGRQNLRHVLDQPQLCNHRDGIDRHGRDGGHALQSGVGVLEAVAGHRAHHRRALGNPAVLDRLEQAGDAGC